jgi:2-furoyl-CoA dehydrogenase 2Fe-2S iron sulfur subunit
MKLYEKHQTYPVSLILNGVKRSAPAEARMLLSDFLRHSLGATGTHVGCEHGICGACTVLVDGVAQRACMQLAVQADGCKVDTVEGLHLRTGGAGGAAGNELGDLQQAFKRHHALQCGFCTAGILMSCSHYLELVPAPTEQQVREMLSGHLCRCTGYTNIVNAVLEVAGQHASARGEGGDHA